MARDQDDLVPRLNGRWFVSAASDAIYARYRGIVWTADTAVTMDDQAELSFTVDDDDQLTFYERIRHPPTWSQYVQRQAEKELQKSASRPTPEWQKPMTEAERRRRRARDLECRLRMLGFHCPPGTLEPLTQDEQLTRSPVAVSTTSDRAVAGVVMQGRIRRVFTPPKITVR